MTVQDFIEFIVDLANDELYEKLDGDARNYLLNGGCYELAKIVKKYVDRCQIVINKSNDSCQWVIFNLHKYIYVNTDMKW